VDVYTYFETRAELVVTRRGARLAPYKRRIFYTDVVVVFRIPIDNKR